MHIRFTVQLPKISLFDGMTLSQAYSPAKSYQQQAWTPILSETLSL